MRCPKCASDSLSVLDSRADGDSIRRRRECQGCNYRFNTFERIELAMPMIVKKDGRREIFDRNKIRLGMVRACEKRPVSVETIDRAVEGIEHKIHELYVKELPSDKIGALVISALQDIDKIAYVRFASVYREFSDVSQFVETLQTLMKKPVKNAEKAPRKKRNALAKKANPTKK